MSTITTPRGEPVPRGELSPRNRQKARALGLTSATGLVIGSIIGTGVFAMPAVLAGAALAAARGPWWVRRPSGRLPVSAR